MGYHLNRLDEPIFMAVPKPMLTEFGIHYILESCAVHIIYPQCKVSLQHNSYVILTTLGTTENSINTSKQYISGLKASTSDNMKLLFTTLIVSAI